MKFKPNTIWWGFLAVNIILIVVLSMTTNFRLRCVWFPWSDGYFRP